MRNLKKILALVLALVMSMSMLATANAFEDADEIDGKFDEAIEVLNALKVFQGYDNGKTFQPKGEITRAEVAAIIYRIVTGDVDDKQVDIYSDYNQFDDVKSDKWYAGYVNFCANAEIIKGYSATKFGPNDTVTGYQALAMILRAIGYDKNGEFTGAGWQVQTAAVAKKLNVTKNIVAGTLGLAATREMVAEILFQTIATAPQVNYTIAFGYQDSDLVGNKIVKNNTLGWDTFGLWCEDESHSIDKWGRPGYNWYAEKVTTKVLCTVEEDALVSYTVATPECQIADDIDLDENKVFDLFVNGVENDYKYNVQPLDTVQAIGAQGTLVEVYKNRIVVIDTLLAKVEAVYDAAYDVRGHLKAPATIKLTVYDANPSEVVLTNGETNYEYAVGDYVLVNAWMLNNPQAADGSVVSTNVQVGANNKAEHAVILDLAESMVGAQTFLWYNAAQHTIDGTNYDDAKWFELDQAGTETSNHTWFFDQYGNLIGAIDIATQYTYGIVENIQWQNPSMAYGYAQATIRYMDGTTETLVVTSVNGVTLKYSDLTNNAPSFATGYISTTMNNNAAICGEDLYRIATAADGTVALEHVFTDVNNNHHNYTVNTNGVVASDNENNHIANAKINKFGTTSALAIITNGTQTVYANSNTVFLVRSGSLATGYTYTVVTGYENMDKYTGNGTNVDWVKTDADSYVDYVFVTGTPDSAVGKQMFYLTSANVQAVLANNDVKYYVLQGIVDGVPGEIHVKENTATGSTATKLTDANVAAWAASNLYRMMTVEYKDGEIINIWGPKADIDNLGNEIGSAYANLALRYITLDANATWDGEVLYIGGKYYNVVGLTPTYGEFAASMANKYVYVVYNTSAVVDNAYVATAVYIVDKGDDSNDSGVTSDWELNGVYMYNEVTKQAFTSDNTKTLAALASDWAGSVFYTVPGTGLMTQLTANDPMCNATVNSLLANGYSVYVSNVSGLFTMVPAI